MPLTLFEALNLPEIGTTTAQRLTVSQYGTESPVSP